MMSQFGKNFGNSSARNVSYSSYRNPSSIPRKEDPFIEYRMNRERISQDCIRPVSARRGLPFKSNEYCQANEYSTGASSGMDRGSWDKHKDGPIRNTLLEEIYSDYGNEDQSLNLFGIDNQYPAQQITCLPDIFGEVDQMIPFAKIGQAEEDLARKWEQRKIIDAVMKPLPGNARMSEFSDKSHNPALSYTNLDPFSRKGSKSQDLNVAVASPTISSSCESEKVLSNGGNSHSGVRGSLNDSALVHSTTNCAGTQSTLHEENFEKDSSLEQEQRSRGLKTPGVDEMLYSSHNSSPALAVYRDRRSQSLHVNRRTPLGPPFQEDKMGAHHRYSERDGRLDGESPSVSGATKLEEALPSELSNVKEVSTASAYNQLEVPQISTSGGESNTTSTSSSPSQIHVAKKQRIISCPSDILEEVRECYALTQGTDLYAPSVHPTFSYPNVRHDAPQPYQFQPQSLSFKQSVFVNQKPVSFNFGTTTTGFGSSTGATPYQASSDAGQGFSGNEYNQPDSYGMAKLGNAVQGNLYTTSLSGSAGVDARTIMSPVAYQSCPDLSSPENNSGNPEAYSNSKVMDASRYERTFAVQTNFTPTHGMRHGPLQPPMLDERIVLTSPASQLRQQTSSAPSTPSKHSSWGNGYLSQGAVHTRNSPASNYWPVTSQFVSLPNTLKNAPSHMMSSNSRGEENYSVETPRMHVGMEYVDNNSLPKTSRPMSPFLATPQISPHPGRQGAVRKLITVTPGSPYSYVPMEMAARPQHDTPLAQQCFMQQLICDDSMVFRSHPLFPLMRDIIIADMNFHTPSFPFHLIANLPVDFSRIVHNYIVRNPGVSLDQGDPSVHPLFMEGLRFAHATLIGKIQARKMKEGYEDHMQPTANVEDMCDSFARSVKPTVNRYRVEADGPQGSFANQMGPSDGGGGGYVCPPSFPCSGQPTVLLNSPLYPVVQQTPSELVQPYPSAEYDLQMTSSDISSSVPYGLNIPQQVYMDIDRRTHSLPASPRKLIFKQGYAGDKDRQTCVGEGVGEKTGKNKVLPKEAVNIMMEWLREHQENPYPNDDEKESLMTSTKLTINQINYWFTNARRRILPKWALQRHLDEQEKARQANSSAYSESLGASSPLPSQM